MLSTGVCNPAIRVGGFGPMVDGAHLTSCFNDVILLPLPTWILLIVGIPILAVTSRSTFDRLSMPVRSPLVSRIFSWLYHLLVLAALLMSILEITRLALSDSGIGLLPFTLAGILLAMVLLGLRRRGTRKPRVIGGILLAYWALLVAFQAVKVDTLVYVEYMAKAAGSKGPAMYPNSDNSLDNYVILGLYAVFTFYELVYLVVPRRQHGLAAPHNASSDEELVGNAGMAERK